MTFSVKSNYGNPLKRKDLSTKVSRNYRTKFLGYKSNHGFGIYYKNIPSLFRPTILIEPFKSVRAGHVMFPIC